MTRVTRPQPPRNSLQNPRCIRLLSRTACLAVLASLSLAGCRATTAPPPFVLPDLEWTSTHRTGGLLTAGAVDRSPGPATPDDCIPVHVRWYVLRDLPPTSGADGLRTVGLASRAELVARVGGSRVLSPTPRLARDAVVSLPAVDTEAAPDAEPEAAPEAAAAPEPSLAPDPVALLEALLPRGGTSLEPPAAALLPGTTAEFDLRDPAAALRVEHGEPGTVRVRLLVHRSPLPEPDPGQLVDGSGVHVALGMEGWFPPQLLEAEQVFTAKGRKPAAQVVGPVEKVEAFREVVVLQGELPLDGAPLVVALPMEFASGRARGLVAVVWATRPPEPGSAEYPAYVEAVQRCTDDLLATDDGVLLTSPAFIGMTEDFVSLEAADTRRAALTHLAHRTNASLTSDLSLAADDALLDLYVTRVLEALPYGPPAGDEGPALGWELEKLALVVFSEQLSVPEPDVVLESLLLRRLGETGRHPSYVKRLAERVETLADFDERIAEQNILWLEDPSPASRMRARDWLMERGLVPPGYDPLGSREQRREALAAYHEAKGS